MAVNISAWSIRQPLRQELLDLRAPRTQAVEVQPGRTTTARGHRLGDLSGLLGRRKKVFAPDDLRHVPDQNRVAGPPESGQQHCKQRENICEGKSFFLSGD